MTDTLIPDREQAASELADLRLRTDLFIDGDFRPARDGRRFVTENPATGQPITEVAEGGPADVDAAVAAARSAFDRGVWSRMDPGARKRVLIAWADLIDANARELGLVETIDAGKPISDTVGLDMPETAACIRWHAEAIDKLYGQVAPSPDGVVATITREPVGVVGAVVPWNYPAQMAAWKLGPALATGNSVVIKPASTTSLSLLRLAELGAEAGIPDGVLNVVTGPGDSVGSAIGRHPDVDLVAFTGSTEVGRRFLAWSAESNLKRVLLELGGKSPQIVFGDATDMANVASNAAVAIFWNMGENCSAGSRLIVHRSKKDELLEALQAELAAWPVGDPLDPATKIGALISRQQLDRVLGYVEVGRSEGARLVTGGERILRGDRRLLRPADDLRRRPQRHADRAGGDLRAGPVGDRVRYRRGGRRDRQRHVLRPGSLDLHGRPERRASRLARDPRRDRRRQRVRRGRHDHPVRWLQAVRVRRSRQVDPRPRPVHGAQDDLDRAQAALSVAT